MMAGGTREQLASWHLTRARPSTLQPATTRPPQRPLPYRPPPLGLVPLITYHVITYHVITYHVITYHMITYHVIAYHVTTYLTYRVSHASHVTCHVSTMAKLAPRLLMPRPRHYLSLTTHPLSAAGAEAFHYLNTSGCVAVPEHDDTHEFSALCAALDAMGVAPHMTADLFACLAGVLHLGNLKFIAPPGSPELSGAAGGAAVSVSDAETVATACSLLGLQVTDLERCLTSRSMTLHRGAETETVHVQLAAPKCASMRDGLAKAIFSALFEWSVYFINQQLGASPAAKPADEGTSSLFIGILDIFGFESFVTNSFEQLLINFANEKLQATFNSHVFAAEQELYTSEGISWQAVKWPDNSGCLALISRKGERGIAPGLLHLIDEVCRLPKTTDSELIDRLVGRLGLPTTPLAPRPLLSHALPSPSSSAPLWRLAPLPPPPASEALRISHPPAASDA